MEKILIIGIGLIGGSVARNVGKVYALDKSRENLDAAGEFLIKGYQSLDQVDIEPDVIVICVPVSVAIAMAPKLKERFGNSIFIDCCSTKRSIEAAYNGVNYAGMHPMAGSEGSGFEHSRKELFGGASMCITGSGEAAQYAYSLAERLGGKPIYIDSVSHDSAVATVSHLPHIIAGALCLTAEQQCSKVDKTALLAAGGFADITRIADSDPDMWGAIFSDNADMVLECLDDFQQCLAKWRELLIKADEQELKEYFALCKKSKQSFKAVTKGIFPKDGVRGFIACKQEDVPQYSEAAMRMGAEGVFRASDGITVVCKTCDELAKISAELCK